MRWFQTVLLEYLLLPLLTLVVVFGMIDDFIRVHWMALLILFFCLGAAAASAV